MGDSENGQSVDSPPKRESARLKIMQLGTEILQTTTSDLEQIDQFFTKTGYEKDTLEQFLTSITDNLAELLDKYNKLDELTKNKSDIETVKNLIEVYQTKVVESQKHLTSMLEEFNQSESDSEEEGLELVTAEFNSCLKKFEQLVAKMNNYKTAPSQKVEHNTHSTPKRSNQHLTSTGPRPQSDTSIRPTSSGNSQLQGPPTANHLINDLHEITVSDAQSSNLNNEENHDRHMASLANTLEAVINAGSIVEPSTFTGDSLTFCDWEVDLEEYLQAKKIPDRNKLRHLKKFVDGEAKAVINEQLFLNTYEAYLDARKLLTERFGNRRELKKSFTEKLTKWPKIASNDGKGVQKFADFLAHVRAAMKSITSLRVFNNEEENEKLCYKLPDWLQQRWHRLVDSAEEKKDDYPDLSEFVNFLRKEARIMLRRGDSVVTQPPKNKHVRNYATSTNSATNNCLYCHQSNHQTDICPELEKFSDQEKTKFMYDNRLCFGCVKPSHRSKECRNRAVCGKCGRRHPTVLHLEPDQWRQSRQSRNFSLAQTRISGERVSNERQPSASESKKEQQPTEKLPKKISTSLINCKSEGLNMILPVYISSRTNSKKEVLVYAMLDTQSSDTLITDDAVRSLETVKTVEEVEMETLNGSSVNCVDHHHGLLVRGYNEEKSLEFDAYTWNEFSCDRSLIPTNDNVLKYPHLHEVAHNFPPLLNVPVALLIGRDCCDAFAPIESIRGGEGQPFAKKTVLGWTALGGATRIKTRRTLINVKMSVARPTVVEDDEVDSVSQDDMKFISIMEDGITKVNGSYQMPLPFKSRPQLPNNRTQVLGRLATLQNKFNRDKGYEGKYREFMDELILNGHAEEVDENQHVEDRSIWYIPHFGVKHPKKDKLRVVFDCSATYGNESINQHLLQGPDMMNNLTGILLRFRQRPIALACDIQKMFYNFYVNPEDRNYLRFIWSDSDGNVKDYRMTVHLFGASSSPAVATYGLRHLAQQHGTEHPAATAFIQRNFYVDDGVTSVDNVQEAIDLIHNTRKICSYGNLRLHKFVSNNKEVLETLPKTECMEPQGLFEGNIPTHRTLGLEWSVTGDTLTFTSSLNDKPYTRRGILSTVAQVYDPLGFLSPYILLGKNVLQKVNSDGLEWDDKIPADIQKEWEQWLDELPKLEDISVSRCLRPPDLGAIVRTELHHFADASFSGIGACSYMRIIDENDRIHSSLLLAKSRVIPSKGKITIPRLELKAALLATQLSKTLHQELQLKIDQDYYYSDSRIVLGYIANDSKRFHVYVANRIREIRERSQPSQWYHIPGDTNPADIASRGLECSKLPASKWFQGPDFLTEKEPSTISNAAHERMELDEADPEVKRIKTCTTQMKQTNPLHKLMRYYSEWDKLVRVVANLKKMITARCWKLTPLECQDLESAEKLIIQAAQEEDFSIEIQDLHTKKTVGTKSSIKQLRPFVDADGLLRVGGRASKSQLLTYNEKHPLIIPKGSPIAKLVIRDIHQKTHHMGRSYTLTAIRERGYWLVCGPRLVKSVVEKCIVCQHIKAQTSKQLMGELPDTRTSMSKPFTHTGMDCFGPFHVKERRTQLKKYGIIFTCLYSRAIHIEVLDDLSTDTFLNTLRDFLNIRGCVKSLSCDHGTNFVGAKNELERQYTKMTEDARRYLTHNRRIEFKFTTPTASHQGGVWERQIRTVRTILTEILRNRCGRINTSMLRTIFYEVMATVNSRPISLLDLSNPEEMPLTPNALLTGKTEVTPPPPGNFREEQYAKGRWKQVQHAAEEFWDKWKVSYLENVIRTQKWNKEFPNMKSGDIVLLPEQDLPRNEWRKAVIEETHPGEDGLVRNVTVRIGSKMIDSGGKRIEKPTMLKRPVQKLIKLM